MVDIPNECPHCGSKFKKWQVPVDASWDDEYFLVCFNDDCSYYKKGYEWMMEQYNQRYSYRYAVNPNHGGNFPLPVWSDLATTEMIVEDDEEQSDE